MAKLRLRREGNRIAYTLSEIGDNSIHNARLYQDKLSGMDYFFTVLPLQYVHDDDHINPCSIGANVRGLIEEFLKKRPQLHVGLACWATNGDGSGPVKLFYGQHKAAAQILLGARELPVRIFVEPDTQVLLHANTNAGGRLRQVVAFDTAVTRHLGSTLYLGRIRQYQSARGLAADDYSFSESSLVRFFQGERREIERYFIDAQRDAITHNSENRLLEFVRWPGKSGDRPLAYSAIETTFFREFLHKKALDTPIDVGIEQGDNPRFLEQHQMILLMSLFAKVFFVDKWDPEFGGRKLEDRTQKGEVVPGEHLCAWGIAREEILANVVR